MIISIFLYMHLFFLFEMITVLHTQTPILMLSLISVRFFKYFYVIYTTIQIIWVTQIYQPLDIPCGSNNFPYKRNTTSNLVFSDRDLAIIETHIVTISIFASLNLESQRQGFTMLNLYIQSRHTHPCLYCIQIRIFEIRL